MPQLGEDWFVEEYLEAVMVFLQKPHKLDLNLFGIKQILKKRGNTTWLLTFGKGGGAKINIFADL